MKYTYKTSVPIQKPPSLRLKCSSFHLSRPQQTGNLPVDPGLPWLCLRLFLIFSFFSFLFVCLFICFSLVQKSRQTPPDSKWLSVEDNFLARDGSLCLLLPLSTGTPFGLYCVGLAVLVSVSSCISLVVSGNTVSSLSLIIVFCCCCCLGVLFCFVFLPSLLISSLIPEGRGLMKTGH